VSAVGRRRRGVGPPGPRRWPPAAPPRRGHRRHLRRVAGASLRI